ncbi:MAG: hypothetical protein AB4206_00455 [Xenococcaceae cyanobacterium]
MTKLREVINFKAAVVGAIFLTALSGLVPESAEAGRGQAGSSHSEHAVTLPDGTIVILDPPGGTFFDGRITVRYDSERVLPISNDDSGWFGSFSSDPKATFPDTGDGIFANPDTSLKLLPPNENLTVSACNVQFTDFSYFPDLVPESSKSITKCDGDFFNPLVSLRPPGEEFTSISFTTEEFQRLFPNDDLFAVNFNFENGLTVDTQESFNFFGFSAQFNQEAFSDKVVGISLVESGTGDIGLFPFEGFNIINCVPQDSPDSKDATDRCGEPDFPSDIEYITDAIVLADSNNPDFSYNFDTREGTLSNGEPFQLFDDSFLTPSRVNEPHNNLGLLALGVFGANLGLKRRRKQQKNS